MSPLARLRQFRAPGPGRRRAGHPSHQIVVPIPADAPMTSVEALVSDTAYCPAEEKDTLHAFLRTGGRICWTCRTYTDHGPLTSTPPRDGAA